MSEGNEVLTTAKEWLEDLARRVEDLQPLVDHARVKISLGKAELRDLVDDTATKLERLRAEVKAMANDAREPTQEIRAIFEALIAILEKTAKRIAEIA